MEHIIEPWPLQRLKRRISHLHIPDQEATAWIKDFAFTE